MLFRSGKDITLQFFFENQCVASFESFYTNRSSIFSIESVEETEVFIIDKTKILKLKEQYPSITEYILQMVSNRFIEYTKHFLSRIKDKPERRYISLKQMCPEVIARVPDCYVATYLGVTPVSLCRIKKRIEKQCVVNKR